LNKPLGNFNFIVSSVPYLDNSLKSWN